MNKSSYKVITEKGESHAVISGRLRNMSTNISNLPVVGDWVLSSEYDGQIVSQEVLQHYSQISKADVQTLKKEQMMVANIDVALLFIASNKDFNPFGTRSPPSSIDGG